MNSGKGIFLFLSSQKLLEEYYERVAETERKESNKDGGGGEGRMRREGERKLMRNFFKGLLMLTPATHIFFPPLKSLSYPFRVLIFPLEGFSGEERRSPLSSCPSLLLFENPIIPIPSSSFFTTSLLYLMIPLCVSNSYFSISFPILLPPFSRFFTTCVSKIFMGKK